MKLLIRILTFLSVLAAFSGIVWLVIKFFTPPEEDPYYHYGDSLYRGDQGEPIRYENEEETKAREEAQKEPQITPEQASQMVH